MIEPSRESHINKGPLFVGLDAERPAFGIDALNDDGCAFDRFSVFIGYLAPEGAGLSKSRQLQHQNKKAKGCKTCFLRRDMHGTSLQFSE